MNIASFVKRAKEMGFEKGKMIDASTVKTAEWVRLKCQYGCGGYNKYITCPPFAPTPEYTNKMLKHYKKALLVKIGKDDYSDFRKMIFELEREIFLSGYYKAFGMACGPCHLCEKCDVTKRCKNPIQARPSMEACGIDVFETVRKNGFKIEVVKDETCEANYFGLVLID